MWRIVFLPLMTLMVMLSTTVARSETPFAGFHLSYGPNQQQGHNDLRLGHNDFGSVELWSIPLSTAVTGESFAMGYRWPLGDSRWRIGPTAALLAGPLFGSIGATTADNTGAISLGYSSEFVATIGGEVGYVVGDQWLVTAEAGVVASPAALMLSASYDRYGDSWSATGYLVGSYYALGVTHAFPSGLTLGVKVGQYDLQVTDQAEDWYGVLSTESVIATVAVGWQF